MNKLKHFFKIHKKDNLKPLESKYLCRVNGGDVLEFPNKLALAEWLTKYRSSYNEINEIEMFKIEFYNLLNL